MVTSLLEADGYIADQIYMGSQDMRYSCKT